eukprot:XP_014790527.1 PREDICTED: synaptotagmin-14-like [Octopus bimaculoides]
MYAKTLNTWDYLTCRNVWKMCCTQREDAATEPCCQNHQKGTDTHCSHANLSKERGVDNQALAEINKPLHDCDNNKITYNSLDNHSQTNVNNTLLKSDNYQNDISAGLLTYSAYAFDDSSSESEDEIIKRYQHSFKTEQKKLEKEIISSQSIKRTKSTKSNDLPSQNSTVKSTDLAPRKASSDGNISSKYQDIKETKKLEKNKVSEAVPKKTEEIVPSQSTTTHLSEPLVSKEAETSTSKLTTIHNDRQSDAEGISNQAFQDEVSLSMSVNSDVLDSPDHNSDEHLFDISDLHQEPPLISKCGSLEVTFLYSPEENTMKITILQAQEIPSKDRGGANSAQVRILLLPTKKQRFKTKIKPGDNPEFGETFTFQKIQKEDLMNMGVRFRLYGCERMRRERMLGEAVIGFASINPDMESTHWILLEPRSNLSCLLPCYNICSYTIISGTVGGKASFLFNLLGMEEGTLPLAYAGPLWWEIDAINAPVEPLEVNTYRKDISRERIPEGEFVLGKKNWEQKLVQDTYVKLTLMSPTGKEIARSKTSIRRGQPNPLFRETFVFQVALFQLPELTLMISVYNKRSMKRKEMIGWFALGMKSSGEEEQSHWNDMCENKGEEVQRWHVLLES